MDNQLKCKKKFVHSHLSDNERKFRVRIGVNRTYLKEAKRVSCS